MADVVINHSSARGLWFRNFLKNRKMIKSSFSNTLIIPSFPKLKFWKLNRWIFHLISIPDGSYVFARNIFIFNLLLDHYKGKCKLIYDGRGAISAEQEEYGVYNGTGIENNILD